MSNLNHVYILNFKGGVTLDCSIDDLVDSFAGSDYCNKNEDISAWRHEVYQYYLKDDKDVDFLERATENEEALESDTFNNLLIVVLTNGIVDLDLREFSKNFESVGEVDIYHHQLTGDSLVKLLPFYYVQDYSKSCEKFIDWYFKLPRAEIQKASKPSNLLVCPKCDKAEGFYIKTVISGSSPVIYNSDGSVAMDGANSEVHSNLKYTKGKLVYCASCNKVIDKVANLNIKLEEY